MELLHNLWNVLTTEDEKLTNYVCLSLIFIEIYVTMKLFTTILNISYTKRQRNIYYFIMCIVTIVNTLLIPQTIKVIFGLIIIPIIIKNIFKISILKSFLAEIIPMLISLIFEGIYLKLCLIFFGITPTQCKSIILYRFPIMCLIYLTMFLLSLLITSIKHTTKTFEHVDSYKKKLLIVNLVFIIIIIAVQFYVLTFYNNVLPLYIILISMISLISYSTVSIYSIIKTVNLEITQRSLEQSELHNKSLELLYDNVSAFKHDFSNIITALGGYIYSNNMTGLKNYYNKIVDECHINNNLSTLNPKIINNPAIYNILATKYYKADELGINIDLQIFINLNTLHMDIYEFCRILGILLDNAIEAASQCDKKLINIEIQDIKPRKCQVLTIENTYLNKDIDINKLTEKGYTSKNDNKNSHGIGLWQVSKILKKHSNVILDTSKDEQFFRQELAIYYK